MIHICRVSRLAVLFLTCWTRSLVQTLSHPKRKRSVFHSSMSLWYVLTDDSSYYTGLLYTSDQWQVFCFCLNGSGFKWFVKTSGLTLFIHHKGKCDSERPYHLLHWWDSDDSDTSGHDKQQSVLTAKIINDTWTEICWAAHCPATTQVRAQCTKEMVGTPRFLKSSVGRFVQRIHANFAI